MKNLFEAGDILSPLEEGYPEWENLKVLNAYYKNGMFRGTVKLKNGNVIDGFNLSNCNGVAFEKTGTTKDIIETTFYFNTSVISNSQMEIIRNHDVAIMQISYDVVNLSISDIIGGIVLTIEGDINELKKLAVALNAETNQLGYVVR